MYVLFPLLLSPHSLPPYSPHYYPTQKSLVQPHYPGVGEGGQETDFIQGRKQLLVVQRAYVHHLERISLAIRLTGHL